MSAKDIHTIVYAVSYGIEQIASSDVKPPALCDTGALSRTLVCLKLIQRPIRRWAASMQVDVRKLMALYFMVEEQKPVRPRALRYIIGKHRVRERLELRVYKALFVRVYQLPRSFDFGTYLKRTLALPVSTNTRY